MSGSTSLGRQSSAEQGKPVMYDEPSKLMAALLTQNDALVAALKALCAKLDADAGVTDTNYAALISNALAAISLIE